MDIYDYREQAYAIQSDQQRGFRKAQLLARAPRAEGGRPGWKTLVSLLFGSYPSTTTAPSSTPKRRATQIPSEEV